MHSGPRLVLINREFIAASVNARLFNSAEQNRAALV